MYEKVSHKTMKLTPSLAERLLIINNFESQRPLRAKKINELANIIRDGLFLVGEIGVATLMYKQGERVLMNGQHQCSACIQVNKAIDVVHEEYICPEPEDASLLFRQFDNAGIRQLKDKVRVEMDSLGLEWSSKVGSLVVAAISYDKTISANQKIELLKHHQDFGEFLYKLIGAKDNGRSITFDAAHMRRVPVVYSMLQTFGKNREQSEDFWAQIRDGEGLKRSMPTYKLRNYLLTHNYGFGRGALGIKTASFHEMISKCITAWNAFRRDTTTDLKYYIGKEIPKAI